MAAGAERIRTWQMRLQGSSSPSVRQIVQGCGSGQPVPRAVWATSPTGWGAVVCDGPVQPTTKVSYRAINKMCCQCCQRWYDMG